MLARTLGAEIRIGKDLAPDLWQASTDRNQIELAVLNLGINARDAMPFGGSLTIATCNTTVPEGAARSFRRAITSPLPSPTPAAACRPTCWPA